MRLRPRGQTCHSLPTHPGFPGPVLLLVLSRISALPLGVLTRFLARVLQELPRCPEICLPLQLVTEFEVETTFPPHIWGGGRFLPQDCPLPESQEHLCFPGKGGLSLTLGSNTPRHSPVPL